MIDEATGKILGMAMAYAVSALGLLLAYVNYRKRVVKAERAMSGTAWAVIGAVILTVLLAGFVIVQLSEPAVETAVPEVAGDIALEETVPAPEVSALPDEQVEPASSWSWIGIILPASIFLIATWLTAALHFHFSRGAGSQPPATDSREL